MKVGQRIGSYEITGNLGSGAMGLVYKGVDTHLGREVAIKVLLPEISRQTDLVERFKKEAMTLARLHHGNVCSVHAFVEHEAQHLMVLQYLHGATLEAHLKSHGAMSLTRAVQVCKDVLEGLKEAHAAGIVHRDLKPANIMIAPSAKAVIMDFGIARVRGEKRATREGMTVCTLEYASPEQIRGEDVDARSDLYSLGVLFYEMLTGKSPFDADTEFEWIKAHTQQHIDASDLGRKYGHRLKNFISIATHKDRSKRFESAAQMLAGLCEMHDGARGDGPASAAASRSFSLGSLRATLARVNPVLGLSGLLTVSGVGFFALGQGSGSGIQASVEASSLVAPVAQGLPEPLASQEQQPQVLLAPSGGQGALAVGVSLNDRMASESTRVASEQKPVARQARARVESESSGWNTR